MTDMTPIAEDAAAKVAFDLLREAYLDLAQMLLRIEEEPARELLKNVEQLTSLKLSCLDHASLAGTAEQAAVAMAAQPVQDVLRAAHAA
ncbi:hypothetical protein [Methylobacterium sp. A54F]